MILSQHVTQRKISLPCCTYLNTATVVDSVECLAYSESFEVDREIISKDGHGLLLPV